LALRVEQNIQCPAGAVGKLLHPSHSPLRRAVIHAISLVQFSLTAGRAVAANNLNARIRLKEEIHRLRQEMTTFFYG